MVFGLAKVAESLHKTCMDIRMLQANGELLEPFEKSQIGDYLGVRNGFVCEFINEIPFLNRFTVKLPSDLDAL